MYLQSRINKSETRIYQTTALLHLIVVFYTLVFVCI